MNMVYNLVSSSRHYLIDVSGSVHQGSCMKVL